MEIARASRQDLETAQRELAAARQQLASATAAAETERRGVVGQVEACQRQLAAAQDLILNLEQSLAATRGSLSWRLTRPLRAAKGFFAIGKG